MTNPLKRKFALPDGHDAGVNEDDGAELKGLQRGVPESEFESDLDPDVGESI